MRHLSYAVPKVASRAFARKYIMLGRLVTQWADIIGPDMALKTQPAGIHRHKGKDGQQCVSLDIGASSADAALLVYRKDLILERISRILGGGMISAIRFVPLAGNQHARKPRKTIKSLTPEQKTYLSDVVEATDDAEIRASLEALGKAILQDGKPLKP